MDPNSNFSLFIPQKFSTCSNGRNNKLCRVLGDQRQGIGKKKNVESGPICASVVKVGTAQRIKLEISG